MKELYTVRFLVPHRLISRNGETLLHAAGCERPVERKLAELLVKKGVAEYVEEKRCA